MRTFLEKLHGTYFLEYGGGKSVGRFVKNVAWKMLLPLELVKPLLASCSHGNENEGNSKHSKRGFKFFVDIPLLDQSSFVTY
eukprot:2106653-Karenia_brevis.AAC.1